MMLALWTTGRTSTYRLERVRTALTSNLFSALDIDIFEIIGYRLCATIHSYYSLVTPESPRRPLVPPAIPRPARLAVYLPDAYSIALFVQLGRVIRGINRSMPDVEHDAQVSFLTYSDDSRVPATELELPHLYVFERLGLEMDPVLKRLSEQIAAQPSAGPAAITTTKAGLFNYLHPDLIRRHLGINVDLTDQADAPLRTAQAAFARERGTGWAWLPPAEQHRRLDEVKHMLVTRVAPSMTPELLTERRGIADVTRWLHAIKLNLPRQFFD